jgi:hypothetical protein
MKRPNRPHALILAPCTAPFHSTAVMAFATTVVALLIQIYCCPGALGKGAQAKPRFLRDGAYGGMPSGVIMPEYCLTLCQNTGFSGIVGGCRCSFTLFTSKRSDNKGFAAAGNG